MPQIFTNIISISFNIASLNIPNTQTASCTKMLL